MVFQIYITWYFLFYEMEKKTLLKNKLKKEYLLYLILI